MTQVNIPRAPLADVAWVSAAAHSVGIPVQLSCRSFLAALAPEKQEADRSWLTSLVPPHLCEPPLPILTDEENSNFLGRALLKAGTGYATAWR